MTCSEGVMESTWELGLEKMGGQDGTIEDYRILLICKNTAIYFT